MSKKKTNGGFIPLDLKELWNLHDTSKNVTVTSTATTFYFDEESAEIVKKKLDQAIASNKPILLHIPKDFYIKALNGTTNISVGGDENVYLACSLSGFQYKLTCFRTPYIFYRTDIGSSNVHHSTITSIDTNPSAAAPYMIINYIAS